MGDLCEAICKSGYAVWSLEYRRVGQPGGGYPGTLEDIRSGAKHITKIPGIDLTRVAVAGHSAGGHLALWLAAQNALELRGVAALAAVTDLRRAHALRLGAGAVEAFIGCAPTECADRYSAASPADLLPIKVPQRLLHGAADDIVPIELSESFAKASANAQLTAFPGAGHFELINPRSKEWPQVLCQITALLTPR